MATVEIDPLAGSWSRCVVGGHPPEVAVFEPVAVAFEADDLGVVDEAVDHGGGHDGVAEGLAPAPEGLVGGDDDAGALVAGRDELEEQVGGVSFEGDVADFVDDDERVAPEPGEFLVESPGGVGLGEAIDPLCRGGEQQPVAGLAGPAAIAGPREPGSGFVRGSGDSELSRGWLPTTCGDPTPSSRGPATATL
jgi:hypothetical protein